MTRAELEHAIRAACDVTKASEIYVFGSQAILGSFPDAPPTLLQSAQVDVAPVDHVEHVDRLDRVLGELSLFHSTHGFYVHGVPIATATGPPGWRSRLVKVQNGNTRGHIGWCVSAVDLTVSKVVAFRDKDRAFVRAMLAERLIAARALARALRTLPLKVADRERLAAWVTTTAREIADGRRR